MNRKAVTAAIHLLGWILFFGLVVGFIFNSPDSGNRPRFSEPALWLFVVVYTGLFYLNFLVLMPALYFKRKFLVYGVLVILLLGTVYWLQPFDRLLNAHRPPMEREGRRQFPQRPPPFGKRPPHGAFNDAGGRGRVDIVSTVLFLAVWSFSTAWQINQQWRRTERRAMLAETDKTKAELSFLKAQINPHFLFNTLNNIYSLSLLKSEQTPAAILKLSGILHYITEDVQSDVVPLQHELDCIHNYIELQQLRLTENVTVQATISGSAEGKWIAPLLFMTFIENAFKYGISSHEKTLIRITIEISPHYIDFACRNQLLVTAAVEERIGIGIENAKKRLNYLYAGKHKLAIDTSGGFFSVQLRITN